MKNFVLSLCFILFAVNVFAKSIKIGTNATYPPFEFIDEKTNKPVGFTLDIITTLLKKSGYNDYEIVDMDFDGLISALVTDKIDVIASSMAPTPARKKVLSFTDCYSDNDDSYFAIYVLESNNKIKGIKDLKDKKIAVELGTIQSEYAHKNIRNASIIEVTGAELYPMVSNKKVDAALILADGANDYISKQTNKDKQIKMVGEKIVPPDFCSALGVRKNDKELLTKLNKALKEIKANGEYKALQDKWLKKL